MASSLDIADKIAILVVVVVESYQDVLADLHKHTAESPEEGADPRKPERNGAVAAEQVERHGYRRTSMSEVARRAGVAKGTVYLYFRARTDPLMHVLMRQGTALYRLVPGEYDDFIAHPKDNGCRSLHTALHTDEEAAELQVRTFAMHRQAEEGEAAHWRHKQAV